MKNDLLDLENLKLPDENISTEQLEDIKKNLRKVLKRYKESSYKTFNDDLELQNLSTDALNSSRNKEYINGIKNSEILKEAVLHKIDTTTTYSGDLLYKRLFKATATYAPPNWWTNEGAFYYYTYITSKEILLYELDNYFRIIDTHKYPLSDIKFYKLFTESCAIRFLIKNKNTEKYFKLYRNFDFLSDELSKVCDIFSYLKIPNLTKEKDLYEEFNNKYNKQFIIVYLFYGALILIMLINMILRHVPHI